MSDLLAVTDYDSQEFIDRVSGAYQYCCRQADRAEELQEQTTKRIDGMKRSTFEQIVEIGEAFLRLQEKLNGEFEDWFLAREEQFGFSLRTAERFKNQAMQVRTNGLDRAYELSLEDKKKEPRIAFLAMNFRLMRDPSEMSLDEVISAQERIAPVIQLSPQLEERRLQLLQNQQIQPPELAAAS